MFIRTALLLAALTPASALAQSSVDEEADQARKARSAEQVTRDGTFLPTTISARVGAQRVAGLVLGGYDSATDRGPIAQGFVEAALFQRVAIRVGVDYLSPTQQWSPTAGVRVGILKQEKHKLDFGVGAYYKKQGFTEANHEFEMMAMLGRRWNNWALFGNLVYGQGIDPSERDGEVRVAALYTLRERWNLGLDARARIDLGKETAARKLNKLEADFDLLAGPMASVSVGPVMFLAQAGVHSYLRNEVAYTGFAGMAGIGAAY